MYGTNVKIMLYLVYSKIKSILLYKLSCKQGVCLWLHVQSLVDVVTVLVCCVHRCVTP